MRVEDYEYCAMELAFRYQECSKGESKFARNMLELLEQQVNEKSEIIDECIEEHQQNRNTMKEEIYDYFFNNKEYSYKLAYEMRHLYSIEEEDLYQKLMDEKKDYYLSFKMPDFVYNMVKNDECDQPQQSSVIEPEESYCDAQIINEDKSTKKCEFSSITNWALNLGTYYLERLVHPAYPAKFITSLNSKWNAFEYQSRINYIRILEGT